MFQMNEEREEIMKNRNAYLFENEDKTGMSSEQIIALQKLVCNKDFDDSKIGSSISGDLPKVKVK